MIQLPPLHVLQKPDNDPFISIKSFEKGNYVDLQDSTEPSETVYGQLISCVIFFFCQNRCYWLIDSLFTSDTIFTAPFSWLKSLIKCLPHMSVYDTLLHFQVQIFSPVWAYVYVFIMWAGVVCHSDIAVILLVTISGDNVKTRWLKCWRQTAETRHKMRRKKASIKNYA